MLTAKLLVFGHSPGEFITPNVIASDAILISDNYQVIESEAGVTDDLSTITIGGTSTPLVATDHVIVILEAEVGHTITVKHGLDNINLSAEVDFVLTANKRLMLVGDGLSTSFNEFG